MKTLSPILDLIDEVKLSLNIAGLLVILGLECLLKYLIAVEHRHPLEPGHELIDDLADLVPVGNAACVDLDIVLTEQALRLQVHIFDVQAALAELSFGIGPVLRDCLVKVVFLGQALGAIDCLLDAVLDLAEHEDSVLTRIHLGCLH